MHKDTYNSNYVKARQLKGNVFILLNQTSFENCTQTFKKWQQAADKFALSFNSRMYTIQTNSEHTEIVVLSVSITITSIRGGQCELS